MDDRTAALRAEVRELTRRWRAEGRYTPGSDSWLRGFDLDFSRELAARGLIGMTWPVEHGGRGLRNVDRLAVTEELLRAGAPVAAHWVGDRQIGPSVLRHGTARLKAEILPGIISADLVFCLGMSEPDAGSDLASVRTTAAEADGGWLINGRKIWTTQAHRATHAYLLARTARAERKHDGLTEFIVDMDTPGISVSPIIDLAGDHHFNEVVFEDVFVPAHRVLGTVGNGWRQVVEQLSFERGGPERVLSTYPLLAELLAASARSSADVTAELGVLTARLATLRRLAWGVAVLLDRGAAPVQEAATLKYLGNTFEQDVIEVARRVLGGPDAGPGSAYGSALLASPGFTIRGGAADVLLSLIARQETTRGAGRDRLTGGTRAVGPDPSAEETRPTAPPHDTPRQDTPRQDTPRQDTPRQGTSLRAPVEHPPGARPQDRELRELVADIAGSHTEPEPGELPACWPTLVELGLPLVGVAERHGGSGGSLDDLVVLVRELGRHGIGSPLIVTATANWVLGHEGRADPRTRTIAMTGLPRPTADTLTARLTTVPWARHAAELVAYHADAAYLIDLNAPGVTIEPGANVAAEPADTVTLDGVVLDGVAARPLRAAPAATLGQARLGLLWTAALAGAAAGAYELTRAYVTTREQFGKPLVRIPAVATGLATIKSTLLQTGAALDRAREIIHADPDGDPLDGAGRTLAAVAVARVIAGRGATDTARIAHQLHGAMGITAEYGLHPLTRRLWAWRDAETAEHDWATRLGRLAGTGGEPVLWDELTS
jgi:alkylation response protein AidB-like acyl-CoA dehydrogenase